MSLDSNHITKNDDYRKIFGKKLSTPLPGDEIVITGLSGKYANSDNVQQLKDHLFNKENMINDTSNRWDLKHPELPTCIGTIPTIDRFDAGYFGIHYRQVKTMDIMCRLILEVTIEALFDAGINPVDLEGTNTGVFVGACFSETEKTWFFDKLSPKSYAFTGASRSMLANRISYFLKLKGPSFVCDTGSSSSLHALDQAVKAIRLGQCDQAIVGGANLSLHPFVLLQFAKLGVLNFDGTCCAFDDTANGYVRSEAISVIVLQKAKNAYRNYMTILHTKVNCDGYKDSGISFPSSQMQLQLYTDFYQECDYVKPEDLTYLEAHGTGTKVGDPQELQAVENFFLTNRKTPLLIGSIKPNIGHTEPASGLCSITKVIIAGEAGLIPPNFNYKTPRSGIKSLENGELEVVTEPTPFRDNRGLIGINNFGFGGANCHALTKLTSRLKQNNGKTIDSVPRLVCVSGRTLEAVNVLLDDAAKHNDIEHMRLLQQIFRKNVKSHLYRGYALISKSGDIIKQSNRSVGYYTPLLIMIFGIIDEDIRLRSRELIQLAPVANTIQKITVIFSSKSLNIKAIILKSKQENIFEEILSNGVWQLVFADLIKTLELVPDKILGIDDNISVGTVISAYFDDALSLKEAVECIYAVASSAGTLGGNNKEKSLKRLLNLDAGLKEVLTKILKTPRKLSDKFINNIMSKDLTADTIAGSITHTDVLKILDKISVENDTVFLDIGNGDIQTILRNDDTYNSLTWLKLPGDDLSDMLFNIGRIFEHGINPQIQNLYPYIEFPVSRGTPMIASSIKWAHNRKWWVPFFKSIEQKGIEQQRFIFSMNDSNYSYIKEHVVCGRNLYPAMGYIHLVWETLILMNSYIRPEMKIVFENCRFIRACTMPSKESKIALDVSIQRGSGLFEITEGGSSVVTGRVHIEMPDNASELNAVNLLTGISNDVMPYMSKKDIYKELTLRGYNYGDKFRALQFCDNSVQVGAILWNNNWVTFMDNMLQLRILQEDTRLLYVPTGIQRLTIEVQKQFDCINAIDNDNKTIPIYASKETGLVKAGGVEIRNLNVQSISKRKYLATPVLEKYVFVPNIASNLTLEDALRTDIQILLENDHSIQIKVVELVDEFTTLKQEILGDIAYHALAEYPLVRSDITVLSKKSLEVKNIKVEDKKLLTEVDCNLVIASRLFERLNILKLALSSIKEKGFILSRESLDFDHTKITSSTCVTVLTVYVTDNEKLILCNKTVTESPKLTVLEISSSDREFKWITALKNILSNKKGVILLAQDDQLNGILGLYLSLSKEYITRKIQLVFIMDGTQPKFDPKLPFYRNQIEKNMPVNIYNNGQWGTYRYLLLKQQNEIQTTHCMLNTLVRGDLSSLKWISGPLANSVSETHSGMELVAIYYSAMNFRDVMTAYGKIIVDVVTKDRIEQECVQGFEFSGITRSGRRVMGQVTSGACASIVLITNPYHIHEIPNDWTLEDAATVFTVYMTTIYGLIIRAGMQRGESILIHSGTGGIGQAAIILALHYGCKVFTTVGTNEKREFIKKKFPQITDDYIGNSRDTSFEQQILKMTNGKGVDLVLNSLAEEKLLASVRCLCYGGRFVEIGKFDLGNDNPLNLMLLDKGASFHGVMLDAIQKEHPAKWCKLNKIFRALLDQGVIKPLNRTVFQMDHIEEAFRYMASGKHTGKVLIQIRKEEVNSMDIQQFSKSFPALPRYYCCNNNVYIICGGLGGFGLELADWLVLRGCRKLVLTSRSGITKGYQAYRIKYWKSYGCDVHISTDDITTYEGCENLIRKSSNFGIIAAVFNLAVVLQDALFEHQTVEMYKTSFKPKAYATEYLDKITRKYCPQLQNFIVFSSVSCGRGNVGQTNYAMANSVMERICENRRNDGLPGLAIEWGVIGEVGVAVDLQDGAVELEIAGTLPQKISSCLQVLDGLMKQNESAIVSSIVVAETRRSSGSTENIANVVANILGVKDLQTISLHTTLAEVGMDSVTAIEIRQTLEREFDVFLTAQDIKSMTFPKLLEIQALKPSDGETNLKNKSELIGMEMLLLSINKSQILVPFIPIKTTETSNEKLSKIVFLFPGMEGSITDMEPLYSLLEDSEIIGFQYCPETIKDTIEEIAAEYLKIVEAKLEGKKSYNIIGYSFGGSIALQVAHELEQKGYNGKIVLIESSPDYVKKVTEILEVESDDKFQISLITYLMSVFIPSSAMSEYLEPIMKLTTFDARLELAQSAIKKVATQYSPEYQRLYIISVYKRLKAVVTWLPNFHFKSKVFLCKAVITSIEIDPDFLLTKYCQQPIVIETFDGNHMSILGNKKLVKFINQAFND